jgi:RNA polymerase sigma-70 factor, ECF subfamily
MSTEPMNTGIGDGDLVRLARDGDPIAFRLLVERHQAMARARARSLCGNPSDVDDVVQESFLRAFTGLDRLRDPDRFAGWLAGIVVNVCRGLLRRPPVTLLPDWPEPLHPVAAHGLPSADDLDRAEAVRAAVAGLPAGQRRAVTLHYYADQPAGQFAAGREAGAARASLHKARRRLRAYLTEHRPDLVPAASRRTAMITVRVAGAERRVPPGPTPIGFPSYVMILADDTGRRALPLWVQDIHALRLPQRFELPAGERAAAARERAVDELTERLLRAAGARVTGVDIDDIGPDMPLAARISLATATGTRHVTARVAEALAIASAAGAPVRVAGPVLDRLAVPLPDDDRPVPLPEPAAALAVLSPAGRRRYEPRNLAFAGGPDAVGAIDGWRLSGSFTGHPSDAHWQDYSCAAAEGIATLSATVPRPAGFAFLGQEIFADDYRGATITFRAEFRIRDTASADASRAGLFLRADRGQHAEEPRTEDAAVNDPDNHIIAIPGDRDWTSYQVTARVPDNSNLIVFGVFLAGPGRIEMRGADLSRS